MGYSTPSPWDTLSTGNALQMGSWHLLLRVLATGNALQMGSWHLLLDTQPPGNALQMGTRALPWGYGVYWDGLTHPRGLSFQI